LVISQNEDDEPKVVINTHHRLWISLNRRLIAGIIEALQDKMDMILTSYLEESYAFEKQDREFA
jgi:polyhydroxyalkanoate synthesis regulator protein